MLTLCGPANRYCDGISRRSFLKIGGLGMGGLSLPGLLRAESQAGVDHSCKSVIMVYLSGGLAHQDTFDLKPAAPQEVRGEFRPIVTRVPGIDICELLPRTASVMDRLAVIRSIVGLFDDHNSYANLTGYPVAISQREGKPHFGSVISRLQGPSDPVVPPFIDLFPRMIRGLYNSPGPGILGQAHLAVKMGEKSDLELLRQQSITSERLAGRRSLLDRFDRLRREADGKQTGGLDQFHRRAFDLLTSTKIADALDVEREPPKVRDRYGRGSSERLADGAAQWNDQLLVARRLVEAGARCVTVAYGYWDHHTRNAEKLRRDLPLFDLGISALVEDIYARGMDRDVTVVIWGEFGRAPTINKAAGRDHWARVGGALMSGGGMRVGQVIGATDNLAASVASNPVHYQDVLATVYHNLGIDPHTSIEDQSGRPISILPGTARPIEKLL